MFISIQWNYIYGIFFAFSSRDLHQAQKQLKSKLSINTINLLKGQVYKILLNGQMNGSLCF